MRGTRHGELHLINECRIIPAHAGNSRWSRPQRSRRSDHPRACGELGSFSRAAQTSRGSSPRMRGTPRRREIDYSDRRIIPAHAGNSLTPLWGAPPTRIIPAHAGNSRQHDGCRRAWTDHPRACGELNAATNLPAGLSGSSPRMRGTPTGVTATKGFDRIIPAHAGNSARRQARQPRRPDHPRACGELAGGSLNGLHVLGSSPRMRGTPARMGECRAQRRIIPAHAGNSPAVTLLAFSSTDHPRACGELASSDPIGVQLDGSSPRMRGTLLRSGCGRSRSTDHPRACGELGYSFCSVSSGLGSSPRMRGTPSRRPSPC